MKRAKIMLPLLEKIIATLRDADADLGLQCGSRISTVSRVKVRTQCTGFTPTTSARFRFGLCFGTMRKRYAGSTRSEPVRFRRPLRQSRIATFKAQLPVILGLNDAD